MQTLSESVDFVGTEFRTDMRRETARPNLECRSDPIPIPVVRGPRMRAPEHNDGEMIGVERAEEKTGLHGPIVSDSPLGGMDRQNIWCNK
jgi:hypothetical protein